MKTIKEVFKVIALILGITTMIGHLFGAGTVNSIYGLLLALWLYVTNN